jgi:hypothetical protein
MPSFSGTSASTAPALRPQTPVARASACSWPRAPATRNPFSPRPSPRWYWTRRGLAEWLRDELDQEIPTLVGIDHAFSFPLAYSEEYRLSSNWQDFLDFQHHWPTDAESP